MRRGFGIIIAGRHSAACALVLLACRSVPPVERRVAVPPSAVPVSLDLYDRAGMIVGTGPLGVIARVEQLPGPAGDSMHVLIAASIPARGLTFERDGDVYRAEYEVALEVRRNGRVVYRASPRAVVRVAQLREVTRPDESIIFQHGVRLPSGSYAVAAVVRDLGGSSVGRFTHEVIVSDPAGRVGLRALPVFRAAPRRTFVETPDAVLNPRASVVLGRDSVLHLYVETAPARTDRWIIIHARPRDGVEAWVDSVRIASSDAIVASTVAFVPVASLGVGIIDVTLTDARVADQRRIAVVVSLGDELPVSSLEEAVEYLRFFVTDEQLRPLRAVLPERRAAAWRDLLRTTDPNPATAEHEALREYVRRIVMANAQFREEGGPGWLTDRGMVLATLGEPDAVVEPPSDPTVLRTLLWEYRRHRLHLTFTDATGFGRWRLTPASEEEFHALVRALGPCQGCR